VRHQNRSGARKGGPEGVNERLIASDTRSPNEGPSEQEGKKIPTCGFDDSSRRCHGIARMSFHVVSVHRERKRGTVGCNEKQRPLAQVVDFAAVGSPSPQPPQPSRQRSSHEQIAPVVQSEVEVDTVDLDLGEPNQWQSGDPKSAEVGVVCRLENFLPPSSIIEIVPDVVQLHAQPAE
jgi:hypothetical protein